MNATDFEIYGTPPDQSPRGQCARPREVECRARRDDGKYKYVGPLEAAHDVPHERMFSGSQRTPSVRASSNLLAQQLLQAFNHVILLAKFHCMKQRQDQC